LATEQTRDNRPHNDIIDNVLHQRHARTFFAPHENVDEAPGIGLRVF
jgi:hypothetical protein